MTIIRSTICFILAISITFNNNVAFAQEIENNAFLPDEPDPVNIPIDGGVSLLIAAGIAYGWKKAYAARNQKKMKIPIINNPGKQLGSLKIVSHFITTAPTEVQTL